MQDRAAPDAAAPGAFVFSRRAPVSGALFAAGDLLVATVDRRLHRLLPRVPGSAEKAGIAAFDRETGETRWHVWGVPPLAALGADAAYAYSRAGTLVALGLDGKERFRQTLPDDRSPDGQKRGDRDATFAADVLVSSDAIVIAAGAEIVSLSKKDGALLGRTSACRGARATVARIGIAAGMIIATCTTRSDFDDETRRIELGIQETPPSWSSLRKDPGDVVGLSPNLKELWRRPPAPDYLLWDDARPVEMEGGAVALAGTKTYVDANGNRLRSLHFVALALDARTGALRWQQESPGGACDEALVAAPRGALCGGSALFEATTGALRWFVRQPVLRGIPLVDGERALGFARGGGEISAVRLEDGASEPGVAWFVAVPNGGASAARPTTSLAQAGDVVYAGIEEELDHIFLRAARIRRP